MAEFGINIDTVYQTVQALANKEQRGYLTPQEFNLFANQAQMEIFDQYFYDINQFGRVPGNSTEYSDVMQLLSDKTSIFKKNQNLTKNNVTDTFPISFSDYYSLGTVKLKRTQDQHGAVGAVEIEKVDENEFLYREASPLTAPSFARPVYVRTGNQIKIYPLSIGTNVECSYIRKPSSVNWGYVVVQGKALYDDSSAIDFELHKSEEKNLVIKILALAGISIDDSSLYQIAAQEIVKEVQQEKQ